MKKNPALYADRKCPNCRKVFRKEPGSLGPKIYCCDECHKEYRKKRESAQRREAYKKGAMKKTCPNCGKKFVDDFRGGQTRRFCCDECTKMWYNHIRYKTQRPQRSISTRNRSIWCRQLAMAAKESTARSNRRILLVCGNTAGRGIDQLVSVIRHKLGADPCSGDLYVFCDETHTSLRYLEWDGAGFCLGYRKAQAGTYP